MEMNVEDPIWFPWFPRFHGVHAGTKRACKHPIRILFPCRAATLMLGCEFWIEGLVSRWCFLLAFVDLTSS